MSNLNNSNSYNSIRKIKRFFFKYKFLSCILVAMLLIAVLSQFIAIGLPGDSAGIMSISFDRWNMRRVNRIEVTFADSDVVAQIKCRELIRSFVRETTTACTAGLNNWGQNTFHLYRDDTLVRRMIGGFGHQMIIVNYSHTGRFLFLFDGRCIARNGGAQTIISCELLNEISYYLYNKGYGDLLPMLP
ncbi:MAG: hypothetical protein FWB93_04625 [Oscillospiraceae bacterium]|nr:hypothetical protein [Oscillospiraceae bacterium]